MMPHFAHVLEAAGPNEPMGTDGGGTGGWPSNAGWIKLIAGKIGIFVFSFFWNVDVDDDDDASMSFLIDVKCSICDVT